VKYFLKDGKALGDGVNIASRIQSLGQGNTPFCFPKKYFDKIRNHPELKAVSLGRFDFKHVDELLKFLLWQMKVGCAEEEEQDGGKLKEVKKENH
jgi:class 3 adenylate cyclase